MLATRPNPNDPSGEADVLIGWQGLPDFEASWESAATIKRQFPSFNLEDKVALIQGGIDKRPPIIFTYKRRGRADVAPVKHSMASGVN